MRSTPVFQTERLVLREWQDDEIAALETILGDPTTMNQWPAPLDDDAVRAWLRRAQNEMRQNGCARWCCERIVDGRIVGDVGIMMTELEGEMVHDLGYIIHHPYWRQGYAFEASKGAIAWARDHDIPHLVANMAADNTPSIAVAEKLGMMPIKSFRNPRNRNKETYVYRIDFEATP